MLSWMEGGTNSGGANRKLFYWILSLMSGSKAQHGGSLISAITKVRNPIVDLGVFLEGEREVGEGLLAASQCPRATTVAILALLFH